MTATRPNDHRTAGSSADELEGAETADRTVWLATALVAALATTLMLESIRVFVSYLVFVVDQSNRTTLGITVLGVFLAIGLAGAIYRLATPSLAVPVLVILLAALRLVFQFVELPGARIWLAAGVIVCWGWLLIGLLTTRRGATAFGLGFGLVLDLVIRISFNTVDLPWMPGLAQHAVTALLILALGSAVLRLGPLRPPAEPGVLATAPVFVVGPALATFHLMIGNLGLAQVKSGLDFPRAAALLALGAVLGLVGAALIESRRSLLGSGVVRPGLSIVLAALVGLGLWLFWNAGDAPLAALGLLLGSGASLALLVLALAGRPEPQFQPATGRTTFWFTFGLVLQVALLFAYYTFSGSPLLVVVTVGLFLLGGVLGGVGATVRPVLPAGVPMSAAVALGWLALLVSGIQLLTWSRPEAGVPLGADLTVMTYNIQNGFSLNNHYSLDRIAQVIEIENPDIVVFQEVSRGWLVASGVDEVEWLSQRLGMNACFGANSDDGLWGNLILSRAPLLETGRHQYATTDNLKRGVIAGRVGTDAGDLWILGTHLDNPSGAGAVRLEQVGELIDYWAGRRPALLAGDFNAAPDDPVLDTARSAGFTDPGETLPSGAVTSEDGQRIDYILATDDLALIDIQVLETDASDHHPVVARFTLRRPRG